MNPEDLKKSGKWICMCGAENHTEYCPQCGRPKTTARTKGSGTKDGKKEFVPISEKPMRKSNNSGYQETSKTLKKSQSFILNKLGVSTDDMEESESKPSMSEIVAQYSSTPPQTQITGRPGMRVPQQSKQSDEMQQRLEEAEAQIRQLTEMMNRSSKQITSLKLSLREAEDENETLMDTITELKKKK